MLSEAAPRITVEKGRTESAADAVVYVGIPGCRSAVLRVMGGNLLGRSKSGNAVFRQQLRFVWLELFPSSARSERNCGVGQIRLSRWATDLWPHGAVS